MADNRHRSRASLARIKAYDCLETIRKRDAFAHEVIETTINTSKLDKQDRAFATKLVIGVVMMRDSLDFVLDKCMRSPKDVRPNVRTALRISAYELLYLKKSPHAAIDQGVELVRFVESKASGLANAVLRKVAEAAKAFPFGDPAKSLGAFTLEAGFPMWLAELLVKELGEDNARQFMSVSNESAPIYVAANPLKGSAKKTLEEIMSIDPSAEIVKIDDHEIADCLVLGERSALADGRFQRILRSCDALISDASSQYIVQLAIGACFAARKQRKATADASCLELCAGRGTKTVLLQSAASRVSGKQFKQFVAVDNVEFKVKLLRERAKEFGANVTKALCKDVSKLSPSDIAALRDEGEEAPLFDLVFLDAPCSGIGTIRRHPEIRWRIKPETIVEDVKRDHALLVAASRFVEVGGILAYSTCTVTSQEDELAVRAFLDSEPGSDFKLIPIDGSPIFKARLKPNGPDAHFCALMLRVASKGLDLYS